MTTTKGPVETQHRPSSRVLAGAGVRAGDANDGHKISLLQQSNGDPEKGEELMNKFEEEV